MTGIKRLWVDSGYMKGFGKLTMHCSVGQEEGSSVHSNSEEGEKSVFQRQVFKANYIFFFLL